MRKLGVLKEVPLREIWNHEQYDFSEWLAEPENLDDLGDILGLTLSDIETEKFVGSYRCDIVAKDETTGQVVLIENQLEPTNHDHLGKIITYASGLKASVIVWIVESARTEHASAIEWLNDHTDDGVSFFLIEIHAMRIGDSDPAPMFKIIEQPNDFNKESKKTPRDPLERESYARRIEFWEKLNEIIDRRKGFPFNKRKATTSATYNFAIGTSACHLCMTLVNKEGYIRVLLWISDSKEQFDALAEHKKEIEAVVGQPLIWDRKTKKASWIAAKVPGLNFDDQSNYEELIDKSLDLLLKMQKAFKPYLLK